MNYLHRLSDWYFSKAAMPYWNIVLIDSFVVFIVSLFVHLMFAGLYPTLSSFLPLCVTLLLYLLFYIVGFKVFHTYSAVLRYSSFHDLFRIAGATALGGAAGVLIHYPLFHAPFFEPIRGREVIATAVFATVLLWMTRILVKFLYDTTYNSRSALPTFIYGIREGGIGLAKNVRSDKPGRFSLKGFLSDEPNTHNLYLMGVKVYELDADTVKQMKQSGIRVLLVSPLKTRDFLNNRTFQDELLDAGIKIYIVPQAEEWTENGPQTSQLREVRLEDLLAREEIAVDMEAVGSLLTGHKVLITGSAGSIGSEMVRQIALYRPAEMTLIDQAETPQHDIRLMMAGCYPYIKAETIVADICDAGRMEEVFAKFRPEYVFHAAAYKHVPMLEDNPAEAVRNNVEGTRIIADLAVKYGVRKFVMISTDKAVNPTNVMGCSKRICEIYVQSLNNKLKLASQGNAENAGQTQFVTTRFGNVLGSNGSVIPLFEKQIRQGGPLTVTHPDITRYFMLIPEACKLVLEAGTMGKGGEIFVFDMGEPVRIADLARRMINLSGATGVKIKYTGLREGEKLYEEVLNSEETTLPTFHEKIKIAKVREYDYDAVNRDLDELLRLAMTYDDMVIVKKMKAMVPEYKSNNSKYEALDK